MPVRALRNAPFEKPRDTREGSFDGAAGMMKGDRDLCRDGRLS
jgi:hypothetical protein